jgi:ATP-dependent protease Clp ATPase subunit
MTTDLAISTNSDTSENSRSLGASVMTPREITSELDKHIVGHSTAKPLASVELERRASS